MTTTAPIDDLDVDALRPRYGPLGRLGLWTGTHTAATFAVSAIVALSLGFFAPRVEHSLAGAGWEASGSQSVQARQVIQKEFGGQSSAALQVVVHTNTGTVTSGPAATTIAKATALLRADSRVSDVVAPTAGVSISQDGKTALIQAGAASANTNEMVRAADSLKGPLRSLSTPDVTVALTGSSGLWSDFNEANRTAMLKSEMLSWPVTLIILVLAFGSLVAAGLPLLLTMVGLISAAGSLYLASRIGDISIWAMNFALMFALALGIDYALFIVVRFRAAHFGSEESTAHAVADMMETAGKAVMFSGLTVLVSLSAVMLVPSPAFRSMALGIMFAVVFVLAATLTLLPAVLAKLGDKVDAVSLPWVHAGEHRSPRFAAWAERLWRRPLVYGGIALVALLALALPLAGLKTGMPSIKVVPASDSARVGYDAVQSAFGVGAPGTLQVVVPASEAGAATTVLKDDTGIARVMPAMPGSGSNVLIEAVPTTGPSDPAVGHTVDRLRGELPPGSLVGGAAAENHDLEKLLAAKTAPVIGVVVVLGFVLLLFALQAPLAALLGALTSLLSTAAAFGVARLVFQGGHGSACSGSSRKASSTRGHRSSSSP